MRAVLPRLLPSPLSMMGRNHGGRRSGRDPQSVNSAGIQRGQPFLSITDRITKLNAGFDERGIWGLLPIRIFAHRKNLCVL